MKVLLVTTLLLLSPFALAHEGHGVSTGSIAHYFSAPHLWVVLAAVALILTGAWIVRRRVD